MNVQQISCDRENAHVAEPTDKPIEGAVVFL